MATLPASQHSTRDAIFSQYEKTAERGGRPHLGASLIGHDCERYLWLTFRWAKQSTFDGRMLRLFDTGNQQEARLVKDLRSIGVEVSEHDENGAQWRFSAIGGHFGGAMDGAGKGLPEAPETWHVLEFKTSNAKSFAALQRNGVEKSKPQHWAQMQVYMHQFDLSRAAYIVVNKDNDDIYVERVNYDKAAANKFLTRAARIVSATEPAIQIGDTADSFICKFCHFKEQCHGTEAPQVNCRTCCHSTAELDGDARWSCAQRSIDLDVGQQRQACDQHRHIPQLLGRFAELMDASSNNLLTYKNKLTGKKFEQPAYSSQEITDCAAKEMLGDKVVDEFKKEFGASVFDGMKDDLPWATVEDVQPVTKPKRGKKNV